MPFQAESALTAEGSPAQPRWSGKRFAAEEIGTPPKDIIHRIVRDHNIEIFYPEQCPLPEIDVCRVERIAVEGEQNCQKTDQKVAERRGGAAVRAAADSLEA